MTLRTTALTGLHEQAGAKLADFGGYRMPIEYPTGVVAEHTAVREAVGVFDVSHMGKLVVRGPGAVDALNAVLVNDLHRIGPWAAQYSMLCNESGGVVDDLIVYRFGDDHVRIIPNAANAATVRDELVARCPGVEVEDRQEREGILAVQGPGSRDLLAGLGLLGGADPGYMSFLGARVGDDGVLVCRTGYTGELGFEIVAGNEVLPGLWASLVEAGAVPCGLGARDTLRTEMGYPLHGQDISPTVTPVEAGLSWAVGWDKPEFVGRAALVSQCAAGRTRALRGLRFEGRGVPRPHMAVLAPDGSAVGETTSGTFSPTLRTGIALALVDPALGFDEVVQVDVRGRRIPARIVRLPFVSSSPK